MANPFLDLWLGSLCAWMGATCSPHSIEMLQKQMWLGHDIREQARRFWIDNWISPARRPKCTVEERMAALSLRVVEGGRR